MFKFANFLAIYDYLCINYVLLVVIMSLGLATVISLYAAKYTTNEAYMSHRNADEEEVSNDLQKDGIVRKIKTTYIKEVEDTWTSDEIREENQIQREQLAAIFELLKKQETELNTRKINEKELREQLSLYH